MQRENVEEQFDLELGYLLAVSAAAVWTPRPLVSCLRAFQNARSLVAFARGEKSAPRDCEPLGIDALARIAALNDDAAKAALRAARADAQHFSIHTAQEYPPRLRDLCDPPPVLYYGGSLAALAAKSVAIVGSRGATPYGLSLAQSMAADFAAAGVTVISGLARGIDAAAHRGCVSVGAPTVAVIGSGLGALYPSYHTQLSQDIVKQGGAVVTEFPPRMPARSHHFPMRNRLVAALADATVVVEGSFKSGALITARLACELGRHVFAIPGDVGKSTSEGTNALIKDGAMLTTSATDVCAVLGWQVAPDPGVNAGDRSADPILHALGRLPADVEEISRASGVEISAVLARLTMLEIQGLVERHPGGLYSTVKGSAV